MLQTRGIAEETPEYDAIRHPEGEVSRFNPDAFRGPNGIWNEDVLPVVGWEAPAFRIVLPADLQRGLGFDRPVLRWEESKQIKSFQKHPSIAWLDFSDAGFWSAWVCFGPESTRRVAWNVFFSFEDEIFMASISKHYGELTFTTVFPPRPEWLAARLRAGEGRWIWNPQEEKE